MKSFFFITLFLFSALNYAADTICYDDLNAFSFQSGNRWHLDSNAADKLGLCAIYTLKEFNFDNSPVIIYPRLITTNESLKDMIEKDKKDYLKKSVTAFFEKHKKFKTKKTKMNFEVLSFNNGATPNEYELVFYHKANKAILLLVLSARNSQDLKKYFGDLETFASNVKSVKKKK